MELERDERGQPATAHLNYSVYRLGRALDRFTENLALSHGITLSQFLAVQVLAEGMPLSNAQLARRTFVSSQAAHKVANELIGLDLVERGDHPHNQRIRLVRLTEKGWRLVEQCYVELTEHDARLTAALGKEIGASVVEVVDRAAELLAGGYFGDDEAEATAIGRRLIASRPRHIPSRLAAGRLKDVERQTDST